MKLISTIYFNLLITMVIISRLGTPYELRYDMTTLPSPERTSNSWVTSRGHRPSHGRSPDRPLSPEGSEVNKGHMP